LHGRSESCGPGFSAADRAFLQEAVERVGGLGSWVWDPQRDQLLWSDNLYRIYGLEPTGEPLSRRQATLLTHPDDRERIRQYVAMSRAASGMPPVEYRLRLPRIGVRHLRSTLVKIETGRSDARRIVGIVEEKTDERLVGRQLALHAATASVLSDWDQFELSAPRLLCGLCQACGCVVGAVWVPDGDVLRARALWTQPGVDVEPFESETRQRGLSKGAELPGQAWEMAAPVSVADAGQEVGWLRREPAIAAGLGASIAFPALKCDEVLAVIELVAREPDIGVRRLERTLGAIGLDLGAFLARNRAQLVPSLLTVRELEVVRLAAQGLHNTEIANALSISSGTVKSHFDNVFRKLRVPDRTGAVAASMRSGLIS
jgi:DNA-binding CsgD family transcriptional regulator